MLGALANPDPRDLGAKPGPEGPPGSDGSDGSDGADGPPGPQGETLSWADVIGEARLDEASYAIGFAYTDPRDDGRYYASFCTGFAAYYTKAIWTNAHCVDGLAELLVAFADFDPEPMVFQSGTRLGGSESYKIVGDGWKHPDYDGTTKSEDVGLLVIVGQVPVVMEVVAHLVAIERALDTLAVEVEGDRQLRIELDREDPDKLLKIPTRVEWQLRRMKPETALAHLRRPPDRPRRELRLRVRLCDAPHLGATLFWRNPVGHVDALGAAGAGTRRGATMSRPYGVNGHRKLHRSGHRKLHTWRR